MIRTVQPDDADALSRMMSRCSPRTRYERFHGVVTEIPSAYLHSCLSGAHLALVAAEGDEVVALASIGPVGATGPEHHAEPEVAVIVEDSRQGRGVGRALMAALIAKTGAGVVRMELCRASLLDYVTATLPVLASEQHGCDVTLDVDVRSVVQ
jgi:GNAT superfamily N-acetyltransferase